MIKNLIVAGVLLLWSELVYAENTAKDDNLMRTLAEIEAQLGGRLGVAILDKETGQSWRYHADDLFPLNSTFKTLACAALLARVDAGDETLDRRIGFEATELVDYSPVTKNKVGGNGMSLGALCSAAMQYSDNTAANLVVRALGGPDNLTAFLRTLGDNISRLDRFETDLNEAVPGDPRDTTTPSAILLTLDKLVVGDVLLPASRQQLKEWLVGNKVSAVLVRSSVPPSWVVGDRTGAGGYGSRSITAVIWPPVRRPVIAAIYLTETDASFADRNLAIARIGAAIAEVIDD